MLLEGQEAHAQTSETEPPSNTLKDNRLQSFCFFELGISGLQPDALATWPRAHYDLKVE